MVAVLQEANAAVSAEQRPIVIVGSGPVGVRVANELHRRAPSAPLVLYGAEAEEPYNRVRLSSLLAGEISWQIWTDDTTLPPDSALERRLGCAITAIDRETKTVRDASGYVQPYSQLVIATGSTPHVPNIPNVDLPGVYTFRDLRDVQQLFARRMRSRRTVVLGGGLLGLEAARAMRRFHTEVFVIEHAPRPMPRQLDDEAGHTLCEHLRRTGIRIMLGEGVRRIDGDCRVNGVELMGGAILECDTVVIATGIRPNIELARRAGLSVGRGIRVDDEMRTSDPSIFAVGECAEHRGIVYGLVAPGYEQAAVAASVLSGRGATYRGSMAATRLKVVGVPVFSIGRVSDDDLTSSSQRCIYRRDKNTYCKLAIEQRRLVGAVAIGDSPELGRMQEAVTSARVVWPWQVWRFRRTGFLWRQRKAQHIRQWPDSVAVCNCMGVTRGTLGRAMSEGACTVAALSAATGASTVCGSCRPLLAQLCGTREPLPPQRAWRTLLTTAALAALIAVFFLIPVSLDYAESVQAASVDFLWRTTAWKQLTGYTAVGCTAVALAMSFRKRIKRLAFGEFAHWRIVHVALAICGFSLLIVHTGGRIGFNLNLFLMGSFVALLVTGVGAGAVMALQHRLQGDVVRWRTQFTWAHILLFWPVPVLLGFHIFKSYYF